MRLRIWDAMLCNVEAQTSKLSFSKESEKYWLAPWKRRKIAFFISQVADLCKIYDFNFFCFSSTVKLILLFVKTVSLCVSVHGSLAVVKIESTTSLFYQVRNVQNYAVECTCQTKLKVCVSVFDLVSWRRGQTTVAVSAYTRTLVGTTHCPSERATVPGKIDLLLLHEKTSKRTCTWYYVRFSGKFHFCFDFWLWLATLNHEQGQQA